MQYVGGLNMKKSVTKKNISEVLVFTGIISILPLTVLVFAIYNQHTVNGIARCLIEGCLLP